jgi:hypothetical protein
MNPEVRQKVARDIKSTHWVWGDDYNKLNSSYSKNYSQNKKATPRTKNRIAFENRQRKEATQKASLMSSLVLGTETDRQTDSIAKTSYGPSHARSLSVGDH